MRERSGRREVLRSLTVAGRIPPSTRSASQAVEFILHACEAIAEAHGLGIIHRDLKPANLFVTVRPDGSASVKVLDFGISKVTTAARAARTVAVTATAAVMGSPLYMSPEQTVSARNADARSDIWALGVTLFEALTGSPPFQATSIPDLCQRIRAVPAPPLRNLRPDVPEKLQQVILRCLEKQPENRYQSIAELAVALAEFAPRRAYISVERALRLARSAHSAGELGLGPPAAIYGSEIESAAGSTQGSWGQTRSPGGRRRLGLVLGAIAAAGVLAGAAIWTATGGLWSRIDGGPAPAASATDEAPSVIRVEPDEEARAAAGTAPSAAGSTSAADRPPVPSPSRTTKAGQVSRRAPAKAGTGQPLPVKHASPPPSPKNLFSDRH